MYGIGTLTGQSGVVMNIYNNFLGGDFQHNGTGIPSGIDVISFRIIFHKQMFITIQLC